MSPSGRGLEITDDNRNGRQSDIICILQPPSLPPVNTFRMALGCNDVFMLNSLLLLLSFVILALLVQPELNLRQKMWVKIQTGRMPSII